MPVGGMHINPFPSVGGARAVSQYACRPRPNFSQLGMPRANLNHLLLAAQLLTFTFRLLVTAPCSWPSPLPFLLFCFQFLPGNVDAVAFLYLRRGCSWPNPVEFWISPRQRFRSLSGQPASCFLFSTSLAFLYSPFGLV